MATNAKCAWCGWGNLIEPGKVNWCVHCLHRADMEIDKCDCLMCQVQTWSMPPIEQLPVDQATRVVGSGIQPGTLETRVAADGVTRRLTDLNNPKFWVEIFETKERAVAVFRELATLLTAQERVNLGLWLQHGAE